MQATKKAPKSNLVNSKAGLWDTNTPAAAPAVAARWCPMLRLQMLCALLQYPHPHPCLQAQGFEGKVMEARANMQWRVYDMPAGGSWRPAIGIQHFISFAHPCCHYTTRTPNIRSPFRALLWERRGGGGGARAASLSSLMPSSCVRHGRTFAGKRQLKKSHHCLEAGIKEMITLQLGVWNLMRAGSGFAGAGSGCCFAPVQHEHANLPWESLFQIIRQGHWAGAIYKGDQTFFSFFNSDSIECRRWLHDTHPSCHTPWGGLAASNPYPDSQWDWWVRLVHQTQTWLVHE